MSWRDAQKAVRWTPFGGVYDLDPPDEEVMHKKCWKKESPQGKASIERIAWIKPY
jgi:hypothetical protein